MPRRLCGREAPEQEKESSRGIHEGTRRFLARFFAHTEASDNLSAAERSVDKQRGIYRKARGRDPCLPLKLPAPLDSFSFLFEEFGSRRPRPGCLASLNEVTHQC